MYRFPSGPRAVAVTLPKVIKPIVRGRGFREVRVLTDWPAIVGRPLGDFSAPERLSSNGVLTLRVAGGWAVEIEHLAPQLLDRIATFYGYRAVTRLHLVQAPLPPRDVRRRREPRALNEVERQALADSIAGVEDEELRAALAGLGRAVMASDER